MESTIRLTRTRMHTLHRGVPRGGTAMRVTKPMRTVLKITQSPLNPRRWSLDLNCGHDIWVTARRKPTRQFAPCPKCAAEAQTMHERFSRGSTPTKEA